MVGRTATDEDKRIATLIAQARKSRDVFQSVYNQFFSLAGPWRPRVGEKATATDPRAPSEQDDIFDTTLQDAADDWASDCADEFTPSYKPWTKHIVVGGVTKFTDASKKVIKEYHDEYMTTIYDKIRQSGFEEQSQGVYFDLAIAPSGMDIPETPAGQGLRFEHVPISELLVLPSPFGGPGDRMREREIEIRYLDTIWPDASWDHIGTKENRAKMTNTVTIIQAHTRDWKDRSEEVWTYNLMHNGIAVQKAKITKGRGSCRFIVVRPRVSAPSGFGIGYGNKGIAPARVLQTLAYLELKRTGKVIDAPYAYSDDGTLNLDGGIDAGDWLEAGEGFNIQDLAPKNDGREAWFKEEDLRASVRRSLFQDKPYQRGDTPPTATQWMDETARNSRRKGFPRAMITREFVLPVLHRTQWILTNNKEIEPLQVEGEIVRLEPISPMSRASDLEEVQMADRHMSIFADRFGEGVRPNYNLPKMMENVAEKLGSDVVEIASEEEVQQKLQQDAANQALSRGAVPGAQGEQPQ